MAVYVLRFDEPLGDLTTRRGNAWYYIGSTPDDRVFERLAEHRNGSDAKIVRAWRARGVDFRLVNLYLSDEYSETDRGFEAWLKKRGHYYAHDLEITIADRRARRRRHKGKTKCKSKRRSVGYEVSLPVPDIPF